MSLDDEIRKKKAAIHTDGYAMAVGELVDLYRDSQLELNPSFQGYFRWNVNHKSALIESMLLGIPLPSIYLAYRSDGMWEVIDGMNRLSTIFELMGVMKEKDGTCKPPLVLTRTKYLPSLENKRWHDAEHPGNSLTQDQKFAIRRTRLDVKIIKDDLTKYEIFLRLNTSGMSLSAQEVRNCILLMENPATFEKLEELSRYPCFQECTGLSDTALLDKYDIELVLRFLAFRKMSLPDLRGLGDLTSFLNDKVLDLASSGGLHLDREAAAFEWTFGVLARGLGDGACRRYSEQKGSFEGGFLIAAFETLAIGLAYYYEELSGELSDHLSNSVVDLTKKLWRSEEARETLQSAGRSAQYRIPRTIELGRRIFQDLADGDKEPISTPEDAVQRYGVAPT
ncbi:MAG: DUF262 domain-containing protein [Thermodesulfobacteriota bacterium]